MACFTQNLVQHLMSKKGRDQKIHKTKTARKNAYMRLSEAKVNRSSFCRESQNSDLSSYFNSFLLPNGKRSKLEAFLRISLVSLNR